MEKSSVNPALVNTFDERDKGRVLLMLCEKNSKKVSSEKQHGSWRCTKRLTEIKKILIVQVFTVISVYRLRGEQTNYKGNIINFLQNIQQFTKRLTCDPLSLNVFVVRQQSVNNTSTFRDFRVWQIKVYNALLWLKLNNYYYEDIIINKEIVRSLPENRNIFDQF